MPLATIPSSPPPSPPMSTTDRPDVPARPKNRARRRSRSAEPILRSTTPPEPTFPSQAPPTSTLDPVIPTSSEEERRREEVQETAPIRAPPPPPNRVETPVPVHLSFDTMKASMRRDVPAGKMPPPPIPMQRFYTDSPVPSTMSGLLQQHGERFNLNTFSGEHPVQNAPPSPPLTRRSTNSTVRSAAGLRRSDSQKPSETRMSGPTQVNELVKRPSTSDSSVSLKEVQKVGKHLGQNPIDYLIPNGSLPEPVSGYFHPSHDPRSLEIPASMRDESQNPVAGIFDNLNFLLDSYLSILSGGGSIAVGTGYRSVARRLLERVEGMFARDLGVDGVGWAEVLEYIRGTRPLPFLCVLPVRGLIAQQAEKSVLNAQPPPAMKDLAESVVAGVERKPAMGKVEEWLEEVGRVLKVSDANASTTNLTLAAGPLTQEDEEEEDKVVAEIIEGILSATAGDQVKYFHKLLDDRKRIASTKVALTRLYPDHPAVTITPPIIALYLLLHPELHPILSAISNVSEPELDLINSGRFDAFLDGSTNVVSKDEEEELNTISSLDKRLWSTLEGLEDEIEELHTRALVVRRALKSRKECIIRKRPTPPPPPPCSTPPPISDRKNEVMKLPNLGLEEIDPPLPPPPTDEEWELSWPVRDVPIMPDDSASNITTNRRRRMERASKLHRDDSERRREKERKRDKKEKQRKEEERAVDKRKREGARISRMEFFSGGEEGSDGESGTAVSSRRRERRRREKKCGECGSCLSTKVRDGMETEREFDRESRRSRLRDGAETDRESRKGKS